jgi:hypothetical protein
MELIILHDGMYQLHNVVDSVPDCFEYCDIYREQLATYIDSLNKWVMKDGSGFFFGCICN